MSFSLPNLPYAIDALEPHVSAKTLSLHHGKHHATYVDKLNGLVAGYTGSGSKTIVPTQASAKLDFRCPPNLEPVDQLKQKLLDGKADNGKADDGTVAPPSSGAAERAAWATPPASASTPARTSAPTATPAAWSPTATSCASG